MLSAALIKTGIYDILRILSLLGLRLFVSSPRIAYSGEGYSKLVFRHLLPHSMRPKVTGGQVVGLFQAPAWLHQSSTDPILVWALQPLFAGIAERCQRSRWRQQRQMSIYLLYISIASTTLMAWSLWAGGHGGG